MIEPLDNREICRVLINFEDQYSIWDVRKEIPNGWREAGKFGTKKECLSYIKEVWTDMRPRSLKEASIKMVSSFS